MYVKARANGVPIVEYSANSRDGHCEPAPSQAKQPHKNGDYRSLIHTVLEPSTVSAKSLPFAGLGGIGTSAALDE